MGMELGTTTIDELALLDWKREIFALYDRVRDEDDPRTAWKRWRRTRDRLFSDHPQSPLTTRQRDDFGGLAYHRYDPGLRVEADVVPTDARTYDIETSTGPAYTFR
ncbi:MAG TPA: hypothetical protein VGL44_05255, partial [Gaiellales bacterium]